MMMVMIYTNGIKVHAFSNQQNICNNDIRKLTKLKLITLKSHSGLTQCGYEHTNKMEIITITHTIKN